MSDKRSTHLPEVAGGVETVTGTLSVDTGLREIQSVVAALGENSGSDQNVVTVVPQNIVAGTSQKITLSVWAADGTTASTTATTVRWMAFGK
jgi:hypothetical protein